MFEIRDSTRSVRRFRKLAMPTNQGSNQARLFDLSEEVCEMGMTLTDWGTCSTIFMNCLVGVATVAGAIIAWRGLETWCHELKGHADFDLARRVMLCVYQFRNEFRSARNIGSPEHLESHYGRLNDKAGELDLALLEAEVLWGSKLQVAKRKLKDCKTEWYLSLKKLHRLQQATVPLPEQEHDRLDAILWGDTDDEFGRRIEDAVHEFKVALRPHFDRVQRTAY